MGITMLIGVLKMPPELWGDTEWEKQQRYSYYLEAANLIEKMQNHHVSQLSKTEEKR